MPAESAGTTTPEALVRHPQSGNSEAHAHEEKGHAPSGLGASRARATRRSARASCRKPGSPASSSTTSGALVPDIRAEAAIIYDPKTGQVLWEQNSRDQRSIASITKVMTATVVLEDENVDLTAPVVIERSDVRAASTTYLRAGYKVTKDDLLHLLLIGSDNAAARALARTSPYGSEGFVDADEREGGGAGSREHQLRRSVGPLQRQPLVGLRHGSAHQLRVGQRAHREHHAHAAPTRCRPAAARSRCRPPISW